MTVPDVLGFTRRDQPVQGELADRLQEPVTHLGGEVVGLDQRLVDQPTQQVQHFVAVYRLA